MDNALGSSSVWMATSEAPQFPALLTDIEADVCVIGAGIAGVTTAYLLAREGRKVVLIDAMGLGAGETGRTTAHFFPPDNRYFNLERSFGLENVRLIADSFHRATDLVEAIVRDEGIDCDFERLDGYLFSLKESGYDDLEREFDAARRAGVSIDKLARVPGLDDFDTGPCLRFPDLAQFHPLKYLNGVARAFIRDNGQLYAQTRASEIETVGDMQVVTTPVGNIRAGAVVVATNTPFNDRVVMHTKQAAYQTYVIGVRIPRGSLPRILLWDNGDPYFYARLYTPDPAEDHDLLVVGGADHKVGQDSQGEHRYDVIETWVRAHFPMSGTVDFKWSGEVMEPADGIAFLGRNPLDDKNVYLISGDSGNGMTHCTAGAMLITDLIMGRPNDWEALYAPSRKAIHGLSEFVKEQVNTLSQYRDWFTGGELASAEQIARGEGAILREGAHKLAVYRDDAGELHVLSATCPHLNCVVAWNDAEKSWDCPCHGSRFDIAGNVLHGPAVTPLATATLEQQPEGTSRP